MGWRAPWRKLLAGLGLSLTGTTILGGLLFALQQNVWWIAAAGTLSLLGGGAYLGHASRESEPVYGTLLAILYFGLVAGILFGGTLVEWLPEPLPGLGVGDSTIFFVWPLLQLAAAVTGMAIGGQLARGNDAACRAAVQDRPTEGPGS